MAQKPLLPVNRMPGRIVLPVKTSSNFTIQPPNPAVFPLAVDVVVQVLQLLDVQRQADVIIRAVMQIVCVAFASIPADGPRLKRSHVPFDAEQRGWSAA